MSFFLLLLFLIASYIRPAELFPALAPYRVMLWLNLGTLVVAVFSAFLRRSVRPRAPQMYLVLALLALVTISPVLGAGWFGGALIAFEGFGVTVIAFFVVLLNVDSLKRLHLVAVVLVLASMVVASEGMLAIHFDFQPERFIFAHSGATAVSPDGFQSVDTLSDTEDESGPSIPRIRSLGFLNDPNDLAQALVCMLPFVALAWQRGRLPRNAFLVVVPSLFLLYGVYLTHSRGALISLVVLAFLAFRTRLGRSGTLVLTGLVALLLVALNFVGGREVELETGRLDAWDAGLQMLKSSPLWGVGFGLFTKYHERTAHNSFVLCFAELGIVGYVIWLALLLTTLLELRSLKKLPGQEPLDQELRRWANAVSLSVYAFLTAGWFLSRTYHMTLYLLLALGVAVATAAARNGRAAALPPFSKIVAAVAGSAFGSILVLYVTARLRWLL